MKLANIDTTDKILYILGFRKTKEYPKPGKIVEVKTSIITEIIQDIEGNRDINDVDYNGRIFGIMTQNTKPLFTPTHRNLYGIKEVAKNGSVCLVVDDINVSGKRPIIECSIKGLVVPEDVDSDDLKVELYADDVDVIEPVLLSTQHVYTSEKPDNINTFGFLDKEMYHNKLKLYRIFNYKKLPEQRYIDFFVNNLVPEFCTVYEKKSVMEQIQKAKVSEDKQPTDQQLKDIENEANIAQQDAKTLGINTNHKLHDYTKRMYAGVVENMRNFGIDENQEFLSSVYWDMFQAMSRTNVNGGVLLSDDDMKLSSKTDVEY